MLNKTILNALNLSESEKAVLKILENQNLSQTTSEIARKANIPRTTTDYILRKFERLKVVRKIKVGAHYEWRHNNFTMPYFDAYTTDLD